MLEFYEKMMDLAEQEYGIPFKKSVVQHPHLVLGE